MPRGNPSPKLAITIDPDIHGNVLTAAARDGVSVSAVDDQRGARSAAEASRFGGGRLVGKAARTVHRERDGGGSPHCAGAVSSVADGPAPGMSVSWEAASSICLRSFSVSSTFTAPRFSSIRCSLAVPGIGTIHAGTLAKKLCH